MHLSVSKRRAIRRKLRLYYAKNQRDLPWRKRRDGYAIWVSEIMLQQTQVATVVPRYEKFLQQFPSIEALAAVSAEAVCEAWAGLGYYRRARSLHAAARVVMQDWGGELPRTAQDLMRLPGIGRYTAGAIASIAFGACEPVVDGNVVRVLARLFHLPGHAEDAVLKRTVWNIAHDLVPCAAPGDWNQALMDLGATLCASQHAKCACCPLRSQCEAAQAGDWQAYPAPAPKIKRRILHVAFAWHRAARGVLVRQRALTGLWAGLWEPPSAEAATATAARRLLRAQLEGGQLVAVDGVVAHTLTHRDVQARLYRWRGSTGLPVAGKWIRSVDDAGMSALVHKAWRHMEALNG